MIKFRSILSAALFIAISVASVGCSDNDNDVPEIRGTEPTYSISTGSFLIGSAAEEHTLTVTADQDWSVHSDVDWIRIFPTGGLKGETRNLTVSFAASTSFDPREGKIILLSGKFTKEIPVTQDATPTIIVSTDKLACGGQESTFTVGVKANVQWTATSSESWCTVTPSTSEAGETSLTLKCEENSSKSERSSVITLTSEKVSARINLTQYSDVIIIPDGYSLVWNDEFNEPDGTMPAAGKWSYDIWEPGFVNNELQRYVAGEINGVKTAEIKNGILNITARKVGDEVVSARLNTRELWTYGYFEARLKLPKGKGTWPAFWMMPADGNDWPHCGEIDIMEEVGTNPNFTSSSIHCTAYNHTTGTQKTAEVLTAGAEDEFHVYALEWTPEYIRTFVDGKLLLSFNNDGENDEDTWPFNKPFHPILNLAWGGDWGGMNGVDESALPAVYQIDYVRVFQKY